MSESRDAFFGRMALGTGPYLMFNELEEILFFAKDLEGRLWAANRALLRRYNLKEESDIWGRTDFEFLPHKLATKFREDDLRIAATGQAMLDIVELYPDRYGVPDWFLTHKRPILDLDGRVQGVMGTIRVLETYRGKAIPSMDLAPAIAWLRDHFTEECSMNHLASLTGLSLRQFERKFKAMFKTTPQQFLIRMRVHEGCDQLRGTRLSVGDIAAACGFYDQSAFTRLFRQHIGMTPLQYRKQYV